MRSPSNVASRRFAGITTTRKLSSASNSLPTTPGAKFNTDAYEWSIRYRNLIPLNKAPSKLSYSTLFNPLSKALPKIPSILYNQIQPLFNMYLLGIKPADRAWFTALNIAVHTQRNKLGLTPSRPQPAFRFARLPTHPACRFRRRVDSM